jgi:hypothetical protein
MILGLTNDISLSANEKLVKSQIAKLCSGEVRGDQSESLANSRGVQEIRAAAKEPGEHKNASHISCAR